MREEVLPLTEPALVFAPPRATTTPRERQRDHERQGRNEVDVRVPPPSPVAVDPHAALARRAAAGDHVAFEAIVQAYADRVRAVALRMLGSPVEADDLAQDVFVAVYGALPTFRGDAKLSTWILRITRNHCLNHLKARSRRGGGQDRLNRDAACLEVLPGVKAHGPQPEKDALAAERRAAIERAIAELPPKHRLLVVLRDVEGLSYEEIAQIAGLRVGTVKSRLHRARERLAQQLRWLVGSDARGERP